MIKRTILLTLVALAASATGAVSNRHLDLELFRAVQTADLAEVDRLLVAGANPSALSGRQCTLSVAVELGNPLLLDRLLEGGRHELQQRALSNALCQAARSDDPVAVARLVAAGADPDATHRLGTGRDEPPPLHFALRAESPRAFRALVEGGATVATLTDATLAAELAEAGDWTLVRALLEPKDLRNPNRINRDQPPKPATAEAFQIAIGRRDAGLARRLLDAGLDPNGTALDGNPILSWVDRNGPIVPYAAMLTAAGGDRSLLLIGAAKAGDVEQLRTLLAAGADPGVEVEVGFDSRPSTPRSMPGTRRSSGSSSRPVPTRRPRVSPPGPSRTAAPTTSASWLRSSSSVPPPRAPRIVGSRWSSGHPLRHLSGGAPPRRGGGHRPA